VVFDLHGKVKIDGEQRNIIIERNPKQEDVMRKLESDFISCNGSNFIYHDGGKDLYLKS